MDEFLNTALIKYTLGKLKLIAKLLNVGNQI